MRISTSMMYELGSTKIGELQTTLTKTQQQLSTQRRILTPADDPVASANALAITQSISINDQFAVNRQNAKNLLQQQESVLGGITDLLTNVKTLVVEAGNGSRDDEQRQYLASTLRGQIEELVGMANSRDGSGNYIFSGYQIASQPFSQTPGGATYFGDQGKRMLQIGAARQIAINDSGSAVFENIRNGNGTFATGPGSKFNTATMTPAIPASANTGAGIISSGAVIDGTQLTGHDYSIVFSVDPTVLPASSVNSYIVKDNVTGQFWDSSTSTWVAAAPAPVPGTAPAAPWTPYVSGQSISFDGLQLEIKGAPADGDAFTVQSSTNQSVFTTLNNLLTTLMSTGTGATGQANLTNGLSAANDNIDNALDSILKIRASLGTRLNEIDVLDSTGSDLNVQYVQNLHDLQDIDLAETISNFTLQQQALEAAQKSFAQVARLSVFNYI